MTMLKTGYYWIEFRDEVTIGYYAEGDKYPWQIVGCDDIFKESEIVVIRQILAP